MRATALPPHCGVAGRHRGAEVSLSGTDGARNPHRDQGSRLGLLCFFGTSTDQGMPVITAITPSPRHPGRFTILVDGKSHATLSLDSIEQLKLVVGGTVAGLEERIEREAARLKVYDRALNMLAFRARSSAELARSLVRK